MCRALRPHKKSRICGSGTYNCHENITFWNTVNQNRTDNQTVEFQIPLNDYGLIVQNTWHDLPRHTPNIEPDEFIIMPDHIHFIVQIVSRGDAALPEIVRRFKTF
jgi:REP element-mobilizing transposase RayT